MNIYVDGTRVGISGHLLPSIHPSFLRRRRLMIWSDIRLSEFAKLDFLRPLLACLPKALSFIASLSLVSIHHLTTPMDHRESQQIEQNQNTTNMQHLSANVAHLTNFIDWNKKRKLQDGQLGLPLPKHKFRDRSCCSEHESLVAKHSCAEEIHYNCLQNQSKSVADSNTVSRESDFGPSETCIDGQPSSYFGSFPIDTSKISLHSLESSTEDATSANRETNRANSNKGLQLESGSLSSRDQLGAFVEDPNFSCSKYGKGLCSEAEAEEMMLYSNGATSNLYVLSSGRSVNKDDQPGGGRKPTIDQEFEQYFSMLMLNN